MPPEFFQNRNLSQLRRDRELAQIRAGVQAPIIDPDRKPAIREYSENETTTSVVVSSKASLQRKPSQIPSSLATQQESVEALESRFYIRKRILVGNFARRLDNSLSEAEAASREIPTHEWRLYLKPFDPHDVPLLSEPRLVIFPVSRTSKATLEASGLSCTQATSRTTSFL